MADDLENYLTFLYGEAAGRAAAHQLEEILECYRGRIPSAQADLDQADALLIAYPDQVSQAGVVPLRSLHRFCRQHLPGLVSGVHILPFYPSSSDDGFSVMDYRQVNPGQGDWEDIREMGRDFRLMFDAVINHVSAQGAWFRAFQRGEEPFTGYFIQVEPGTDLAQVVRPRALPLLTPFETTSGGKSLWTTFSGDQVDLNYRNPAVLLEIIDLLLFYASRGASFIRLDAIAYLWKEPGTACINLPQTHRIIQLFRAVLDRAAPHVHLITETNVPHEDNISYFGHGENEAHLVYNFALPPLVLHTLQTGDATPLASWAAGLALPSSRTAFFNFLASHDGIGLNPARGILSDLEIDQLVRSVQARSGLVSNKANPDGTHSPYELNINYFDALLEPGEDPLGELPLARFLNAHAILLSMPGVPGIYFHSLFGSRGWADGVLQSGHNRTINRQKLSFDELESQLGLPDSLRARVFRGMSALLARRAAQAAFHPSGSQRVLEFGAAIFAHLRTSPDNLEKVICLHNVTRRDQTTALDLASLGGSSAHGLVSGERFTRARSTVHLQPYQFDWIRING